jgi:hypothetical protein
MIRLSCSCGAVIELDNTPGVVNERILNGWHETHRHCEKARVIDTQGVPTFQMHKPYEKTRRVQHESCVSCGREILTESGQVCPYCRKGLLNG